MKIKRIAHLGIAVKDLAPPRKLYETALGLTFKGEEVVETQKVKVNMIRVGESNLELLLPTTSDSPVAKFLEKNGPGIHHVAYEVEDIKAALAKLEKEGARLIDRTPRKGAHGTLIAFVHPKSSHGVLTELCQTGH